MHHFKILKFYLRFFKLAIAFFKITTNLVRVAVGFNFFSQTLVQNFQLRRLALLHVRLCTSPRIISFHNQKYNIFIGNRLSFNKVVCEGTVCLFKNFCSKFRKNAIFCL